MDDVQSITQLITQIGVFGALFIYLLRYVMKTNDEREKRLTALLSQINDCVYDKVKQIEVVVNDVSDCIDDVKSDVIEIKQDVGEIKYDVCEIKRDIDILRLNKI